MEVGMESVIKIFLGSVALYYTVSWIGALLTVLLAIRALKPVGRYLEKEYNGDKSR